MLPDLEINHIGVVIECDDVSEIESQTGAAFVWDDKQGVLVCFVRDERLGFFVEYITREGRASNYNLGFNHVCYNVQSSKLMSQMHEEIIDNKIGIRLTLPEKSAAEDYCNLVTFYKLFGIGIVEYNILDEL